ncbi:MAG: GYF domain-containing protein [Phycisphaeraceae bacterium]
MASSQAWYVNKGGRQVGPIDAAQLKHMATSGQLSPQDYVWKEGMAQWVHAQQVKGLFGQVADLANAGTAPPPSGGRTGALSGAAAALSRGQGSQQLAHGAHGGTLGTGAGWVITAAILLLLTLVIPWSVHPFTGKIIFSWDTFKGKPAIHAIWLIGSWVVAVAALIVTPLTRGIARAWIWAGMGALLILLLLILVSETSGFGSGGPLAIGILTVIFFFIIVIFSHSRIHLGPSTAIRVMQILGASGFILMNVIEFIMQFTASGSDWKQYGAANAPWGALLRVEIILQYTALMSAGTMILFQGILPSRSSSMTKAGLMLMYLAIIIGAYLTAICYSAASGYWGMILETTVSGFLMVGMIVLLANGLIQITDHIRKALAAHAAMQPAPAAASPAPYAAPAPADAPAPAAQPAPQPAPKKETIEEKFAHLKKLKDSGIITEEEFQEKRKKLVEEL